MNFVEFPIINSCWIKFMNGLMIVICPGDFKPKVRDLITLIDLNGNSTITTIGGVERFTRAIDYPNDNIGLLLDDFNGYVDMTNWKCLFYAKP